MSESTGGWMRWMAVAAGLCAILILPVVWDASRGWIFPDGVSYLDMASGAVRDSPAVLLKNAYWSPGYPAILAVMMAVVRPSLASELHAVYVVHWLIFLVATACFSLLLGTLLQWLRRNSWPELARDGTLCKALVCFGYAFFLLSNMNQTMWYTTPDMLLQGLVYLSAACGLRLFLPDSSWKHSVALGLTLGVGYLVKAAMFPAALLLIAILFLKPPQDRLGRRHAAIALACFCLAAAPLVLSLSLEKHRFTFGDSGKLAYAWFVNGIPPYAGWTGQPAESGTPVHAPRKLRESPLVLEFRTPVSGTLPIWYDPSYWWEGVRAPVSVRRQWTALFRPFRQVHSRETSFLALAAALGPLCLLSSFRIRKAIWDGGRQAWILIGWPAAVCLMHSLLLFTYRFLIGYLVLACLGAAALILRHFQAATRTRALLVAALLVALAGTARILPILQAALHPDNGGSLTLAEGMDNGPSSSAVAQALARLGIRPGDEISVLGHSLDCYYARLAGVRIVAQIWEDPDRIQGLSAPEVHQVLGQLRQIGVKALVSRGKPGFVNDEGWIAIPRTDVYVRML
jgi:4-amino-4-deoxy-L-arabinose transferase-like glycosyltransferase